jgi:hypothetical protein
MKHTFNLKLPIKVVYDDEAQQVTVDYQELPRQKLPDGSELTLNFSDGRPKLYKPRPRSR